MNQPEFKAFEKCPDCGFTGGHSNECSWHSKLQAQTPQKLMRLVLANGNYFDIGPLPPGFDFQAAMNTVRLSGAWLSDNMFVLKEQIGCVFCWSVGNAPPTVTPAADWANDTGETQQ